MVKSKFDIQKIIVGREVAHVEKRIELNDIVKWDEIQSSNYKTLS